MLSSFGFLFFSLETVVIFKRFFFCFPIELLVHSIWLFDCIGFETAELCVLVVGIIGVCIIVCHCQLSLRWESVILKFSLQKTLQSVIILNYDKDAISY